MVAPAHDSCPVTCSTSNVNLDITEGHFGFTGGKLLLEGGGGIRTCLRSVDLMTNILCAEKSAQNLQPQLDLKND